MPEEENEDQKRIKDTNVENIGSAEDKAVRKAAAATEPAWQGAGLKPGIEIWRIEQFKVVAIPPESYGTFYEGDSYIVLHTKKEPDTDKLLHDIHFFIGKDSTPDEYGSAAYKTVELDDFFDQEPIQYREHQTESGGPSDMFKALFPDGIKYEEGGVVSGFRHVEKDKYDSKLYQVRFVKGKLDYIRCPLHTNSLCAGDSFVLDAPKAIYVLDGPESNAQEKREANLCAERIEDQRAAGISATHDIDDDFWACLEGEQPDWFEADHVVIGGDTPGSLPKRQSSVFISRGSFGGSPTPPPDAASFTGTSDGGIYPLEVLKLAGHPDDVDPTQKEQHLSDAEFQEVFKMSKAEFGKLAKWKQVQAKKANGLF